MGYHFYTEVTADSSMRKMQYDRCLPVFYIDVTDEMAKFYGLL